MTLDEAIKHAEDVSSRCVANNPTCSLEHKQLANWLRELKELRKKANNG